MREKKGGKIKRDDFIFLRDVFYFILFYSNEDSGTNFWVPFKMDPKF